MIICMFDLLCVTSRLLCRDDFFERIKEAAACSPAGIVLREKDLSASQYKILAEDAMEICKAYHVPCILHNFLDVALEMKAKAIHLPLPILRTMTENQKRQFSVLGASCHSLQDAREAQMLGCTYITAGHVFFTDCKQGVPPRGVGFLKEICEDVSIPVFAIGGINFNNIGYTRKAGARGVCVMSSWMQCDDVKGLLLGLKESSNV